MKAHGRIAIIVLSFGVTSPVVAADWENAHTAYDVEDYQIAIWRFKPLAE